ncbi:MAG: HU family DNA-binding protein [Candidatus Aenigmatarchaeota archaeon]
MNKEQLVKEVARKTELPQATVRKCLDGIIEVVSNAVKKGEEVKILGFGTFRVVTRKERKGVDPRTKKEIVIPAKKIVKFNPGKELKLT